MKLDCEVIRDLLPLYAEHMASPASTALVEEHLRECEACRAELEQMLQPVPVQPEPQPDAPLKGIRASLRKKSILTAAAAVLAVLCAVVLVFWMVNFVIFFWEDIKSILGIQSRQRSRQTIQFKSAVRQQKKAETERGYRHKCEVCGHTDADHPELEFRYCSKCQGYHCFCSDHIFDHQHFTK